MTVHELVTLIAAAGTLTAAATSGFVIPPSAKLDPHSSTPVAAATAQTPATEGTRVQKASPRPQTPESTSCRSRTGTRQESAAPSFCPLPTR